MKKYFLLLLLLINSVIFPQSVKYAILSNLSAVRENPAFTADSLSKAMAIAGEINSLICLGNVSIGGSYQEFENAKFYLDSLKLKYNILGGQNDFKQNLIGLLNFKKHFTEDNFLIIEGDYAILGIQTIDFINNDKGHLTKETLDWLRAEQNNLKNKKIILFLNSEIDKIDNAETLLTVFDGLSVIKIITPRFAEPIKKGNKNYKRMTAKKQEALPLLHIFEIKSDSLFNYGFSPITGLFLKEKEMLKKIDLQDIIKVSGNKEGFQNIINTNSSTVSNILKYKNNFILSNLDGSIVSYNPDFTVKWRLKIEGNLVSSPIIVGGKLIAASTQGEIFILDADSKAEIQSIGTNYEITSPLAIIDYKGDKELLIPKTSDSHEALVFGASSGEIFCYDLETLQELWVNTELKSPIMGNIINAGSKLAFMNCEGKIICLDNRTGLLIWKWGYEETFANTKASLYFNGKQIITITNNGSITGIDILLGVSEWQTESTNISDFSGVPDRPDTIIALSNNKLIYYDSKKGKKINEIKLKEKDITSFLKPDLVSNRQFLLSNENILYRLEKYKSLKKIGHVGRISIVSFINEQDNNIILLTIDGQLIQTALK